MKQTRTSAEIKAATDKVYSQMRHQPQRRGFLNGPLIDTGCCTAPSCSNRRCTCSRKRSAR